MPAEIIQFTLQIFRTCLLNKIDQKSQLYFIAIQRKTLLILTPFLYPPSVKKPWGFSGHLLINRAFEKSKKVWSSLSVRIIGIQLYLRFSVKIFKTNVVQGAEHSKCSKFGKNREHVSLYLLDFLALFVITHACRFFVG